MVATSVGEEGLDIPSADLVVFYEPVSSEIRTIQRRGRTGRRRSGEVVVLIAEGTRDESAKDSARRKEEFMHKAARRVARGLRGSPHRDLSNLSRFSVSAGNGSGSAANFVLEARERHRGELVEEDKTPAEGVRTVKEDLPPESFRPRGQTGLDQF